MRRTPPSDELPKGAALLFLAGALPREDVAVDVRGDGGEDQVLEFVRLQGFDLPLSLFQPHADAW
ncbi:hypothetical protein [Streptomyces sp. NBC_01244]|uniref:hypothetical protein n=1 Tax=Streptomyces sp. NBC_01244 TaxID=2903797 RepID=UPI002E1594AF|nr:hypothetical protein OG247_00475 [Streptomyces sp. NBC_01244]